MTAVAQCRERDVDLSDGRSVRVCEWGPESGQPVIHFHGSSSSRLERPPDLGILDRANVRLVTMDRPGHGGSSEHPHRRLLDWPADVAQVANHLGIDELRLSGWSIGGPHALAAAHALKDRVIATAVVAPYPPPGFAEARQGMTAADRSAVAVARHLPRLVRLGTKLAASSLRRRPDRALGRLRKNAPPSDRDVIDDAGFGEMFLPAIAEAYRQGSGPGWEATMIVQPWGFDLAEITGPVALWHGSADRVVPIASGRFISSRLPNSELIEVPERGHFVLFDQWTEILSWLTGIERGS